MTPKVAKQVEALADMTVAELRERYAEVFGESTRSKHRAFLRKRVAWGLQAKAEGGLSERARQRAEDLARDCDLRLTAPRRTVTGHLATTRDRRLPMPGAVITRQYRGQTVAVTVLADSFAYDGAVCRSLTAVAKAVTGCHWNGLLFFRLTGGKR